MGVQDRAVKSNFQVSKYIAFVKMFFHRYVFLVCENPCMNSDEITDLMIKTEMNYKSTQLPCSPFTSQRERNRVHDTPSVYQNTQVMFTSEASNFSTNTHTHINIYIYVCLCVITEMENFRGKHTTSLF